MVGLVSILTTAVMPVISAPNTASVTPWRRMVCKILPFSMLSSAVPVNARLGVVVNQRYGNVRQQNGEGDPVRITAVSADKPYQQADQCAEDQAAFRRG